MRRTDKIKFPWPSWNSFEFVKNRRHCRKFYSAIAKELTKDQSITICFSGGVDSTVLAHATYNAYLMYFGVAPKMNLVYINHQFRSEEHIQNDINHIKAIADSLHVNWGYETINCEHNQASAREARYNALANKIGNGIGLLGHHANDVVETKLFQFLTGRPVTGIAKERMHNGARFVRPMLGLLREDVLEYARIWNLSWSEDCSNKTNEYTRNRIRHDLIPWIEQNVNEGIVKILSSS
jgi:tRNA(Ile)-lysidine synthase